MNNQDNKDYVVVVLTQSLPIPITYLPKYNTTFNDNVYNKSIRQSPRLSSSFLSNSVNSSIK